MREINCEKLHNHHVVITHAQPEVNFSSTVLPAYLVPAYLVTRLSRHFFQSPLPFTCVILKSYISSFGYLVILTPVRALTR